MKLKLVKSWFTCWAAALLVLNKHLPHQVASLQSVCSQAAWDLIEKGECALRQLDHRNRRAPKMCTTWEVLTLSTFWYCVVCALPLEALLLLLSSASKRLFNARKQSKNLLNSHRQPFKYTLRHLIIWLLWPPYQNECPSLSEWRGTSCLCWLRQVEQVTCLSSQLVSQKLARRDKLALRRHVATVTSPRH